LKRLTVEANATLTFKRAWSPALKIRLRLPRTVRQVRSVERGPLRFAVEEGSGGTTAARVVACEFALGITDVVLFE
jgi:hypothetical protein